MDKILNKERNYSNLDFQEGCLILVDKPLEWTSFDVVNKIRFSLKHGFGYKKIKVGHAGTLDPLATGLLLVCTGKYTKRIIELQDQDKSYTGLIKLGATTPSYDAEADEDQQFPVDHIDDDLIEKARLDYLGPILQMPPIFSAIKIKGQAAYKLARRGEEVTMKKRSVIINSLQLNRTKSNELSFEVSCSKGTYIRSMAHDLGLAMNSGAYLTSLRRTEVGSYQVKDAMNIEDIIKIIDMLAAE